MYWNQGNDDYVFAIWPDAADLEPVVYQTYMSTSNSLCSAFAPALSEGAVIPDSWSYAEVLWAIYLWARMRATEGGNIGADEFAIPIPRYDLMAQDILRPKTSKLKRLR